MLERSCGPGGQAGRGWRPHHPFSWSLPPVPPLGPFAYWQIAGWRDRGGGFVVHRQESVSGLSTFGQLQVLVGWHPFYLGLRYMSRGSGSMLILGERFYYER